MRRVRGALGMGLVWAIGGAGIGGVMEMIANFVPGLNAVDMWIQLLAIPGFVGGVIFSIVLGIAARNRRFEELSMRAFAGLGALGGVLLGMFTIAVLGAPAWFMIATVLFSASMASGSLALARMAERGSIGTGTDGSETRLPRP